MRNIIVPGTDAEGFLRRAMDDGYSMQDALIDPAVAQSVSCELDREQYLEDYVELESTDIFEYKDMEAARILHGTFNRMISRAEGRTGNHLPLFSVRVFEPGEHSTTIHRNDPGVGPWAVGFTLSGNAPFNVYQQGQLPGGMVIPLKGDGGDPRPLASMETCAGSGWALYTAHEQVPHSGGLVRSSYQRELLILYGVQ